MRPLPALPTQSKHDRHEYLERAQAVFRVPMYATTTLERVEHAVWLAPEAIAAPLAYIRLLAVLARRGVGARLEAIGAVPRGWADVALGELRAATSPGSVGLALRTSVTRITARRAEGRALLAKNDDPEDAAFTWATGAELALAVLDLDVATDGQWTADAAGARKEAVLCLGNAAQMMARMRKWRPSLVWATCAVELAEQAGPGQVEEQYLEKNSTRVETARRELRL
jgi:hypothetical protein